MNSADSFTATGKRVTRIGLVDRAETHCKPPLHLSLGTKHADRAQPQGDDSLGLILGAEDAVEWLLSLLVMRLGNATPAEQKVLIKG